MILAAYGSQSAMRDILKELNDGNPSDARVLDERGLRRFEVLREIWAKIAEAERARRQSLPEPQLKAPGDS
jgi:hypothetical protein